jgi:hypothetical protein
MKNIFFMHIPKCGGTSLTNSMAELYPDHSRFRLRAPASSEALKNIGSPIDIDTFRSGLLLYAMRSTSYNFIAGHFLFNNTAWEQYHEDFEFITVIRNPVERFISHYFFNKSHGLNHFTITDELDSYLESDEASELGRFLLKYFGGIEGKNDMPRAIENVAKFDIIGQLDDLDTFNRLFKNRYGVRLSIEHTNRNPKGDAEKKFLLNQNTMDRIIRLCEPDLKIYEYIRNFKK